MGSEAANQYRISQVGAERMLRLAEFLDILPKERFDFSTTREERSEADVEEYGGECGTVGCAIGWCPNALPELCSVKNGAARPGKFDPMFFVEGELIDTSRDWVYVGQRLFGISEMDSFDLFTPWHDAPHDGTQLSGRATPKQVAQRLRGYVEWALRTPPYERPEHLDDGDVPSDF